MAEDAKETDQAMESDQEAETQQNVMEDPEGASQDPTSLWQLAKLGTKKEEPQEGEVNPLSKDEQCYKIHSYLHKVGFHEKGVLVFIPLGGTQTSYKEIVRLRMIFHWFNEPVWTGLLERAEDQLAGAKKRLRNTFIIWAILTLVLYLTSSTSNISNEKDFVFGAIFAGLLIGWKLIPDIKRIRRSSNLNDRIVYQQQLKKATFGDDTHKQADLQEIYQFLTLIETCDYQKASKLARENDWHLLVNEKIATQHYYQILDYFRKRKRGQKAQKAKKKN